MSHNLHASSNFFSHWRCLLYFICLEISQNFARNKRNCFFDKDLVLKAEFRKKTLTDWHESSHCCCHTVTRSREDKSVIRWIVILRNLFCDILYVKKSHQDHAIHLKSLSDTLNLCYFESTCITNMYTMWYERVSRWYENGWYEKTLVRKARYSNGTARLVRLEITDNLWDHPDWLVESEKSP